MRNQAELEKLRKIFTVKSKGTTIQSSDAFALRSQGASKRKSSLRSFSRILCEGRHHECRNTFWSLGSVFVQVLRTLFAMSPHYCRGIARKWRFPRKHLVRDHP